MKQGHGKIDSLSESGLEDFEFKYHCWQDFCILLNIRLLRIHCSSTKHIK